MKHALAYFFALVFLGLAVTILWIGHAGLTTFDKAIATGATLFACALAGPADFEKATTALKPYLPFLKSGAQ